MDKKHSKGSAVVIGFLVLLAFLALLYTYHYTKWSASEISTITLDKVNMVMTSSDGESHSVEIQVSLEGLSQTLNKVDKNEFALVVADTLSNSDYDKIMGKDGTEYIKNNIKNELQKNYGNAVEDVYITGLLCDTKLPDTTSNETEKRKDTLKGLFPNME